MNIEREMITHLISTAEDHDLQLIGVDDGDGELQLTDNHNKIIEIIESVDESWLWVRKNNRDYFVLIILGNGIDVFSNWSNAIDEWVWATINQFSDETFDNEELDNG